jgi:hypothetical protein
MLQELSGVLTREGIEHCNCVFRAVLVRSPIIDAITEVFNSRLHLLEIISSSMAQGL